jgi:hypothetical protein
MAFFASFFNEKTKKFKVIFELKFLKHWYIVY